MIKIKLDRRFKMDHLDLMMTPNSVEKLRMEENNLQSISNWTDLKGKSLEGLLLCKRGHTRNGHLRLNLGEFTKSEIENPLKDLHVSRGQIAEFFGIKGEWTNQLIMEIRNWINRTTLDSLRILQPQRHGRSYHTSDNTVFRFYNDGRVRLSNKDGEDQLILESYRFYQEMIGQEI